MAPIRDYYAMLGVLPDAEDIVVRAAYRALAQRYHPDRRGAQPETHARMCDLNEAFGVLSDVERRRTYDEARRAEPPSPTGFAAADDGPAAEADPPEPDWHIATQYCPELAALEDRLRRFSWTLACTYRAALLETRDFDSRGRLAQLLEAHFLSTHFGTQPRNLAFARNLIVAGERATALALNRAIRVFGTGADPCLFLSRIATAHAAWQWLVDVERLRAALDGVRACASAERYARLLQELGGRYVPAERNPQASSRGSRAAPCDVDFGVDTLHFVSTEAFCRWSRAHVLPIARGLTA